VGAKKAPRVGADSARGVGADSVPLLDPTKLNHKREPKTSTGGSAVDDVGSRAAAEENAEEQNRIEVLQMLRDFGIERKVPEKLLDELPGLTAEIVSGIINELYDGAGPGQLVTDLREKARERIEALAILKEAAAKWSPQQQEACDELLRMGVPEDQAVELILDKMQITRDAILQINDEMLPDDYVGAGLVRRLWLDGEKVVQSQRLAQETIDAAVVQAVINFEEEPDAYAGVSPDDEKASKWLSRLLCIDGVEEASARFVAANYKFDERALIVFTEDFNQAEATRIEQEAKAKKDREEKEAEAKRAQEEKEAQDRAAREAAADQAAKDAADRRDREAKNARALLQNAQKLTEQRRAEQLAALKDAEEAKAAKEAEKKKQIEEYRSEFNGQWESQLKLAIERYPIIATEPPDMQVESVRAAIKSGEVKDLRPATMESVA
jgi:flagellar biosynthesis GTPase FlhF